MQLVARLNKQPRVIRFPFLPHPVRLRLDGMGVYKDAIGSLFPGNRFAPEEIRFLIHGMWRMSHGELAAVYRETLPAFDFTPPRSRGHREAAGSGWSCRTWLRRSGAIDLRDGTSSG